MKTLQEQANEWVEKYAFEVPYNKASDPKNEDFYNTHKLLYGKDGFLAGYESAKSQLSALQQENEKLKNEQKTQGSDIR